ncbi:hypothetical protein [Sanguibacter massiliensis]|nr:hypothetical protein [Sanguibacter massiliensis]
MSALLALSWRLARAGGLVVACAGVLAVAVASARVRLTPELLRAE